MTVFFVIYQIFECYQDDEVNYYLTSFASSTRNCRLFSLELRN